MIPFIPNSAVFKKNKFKNITYGYKPKLKYFYLEIRDYFRNGKQSIYQSDYRGRPVPARSPLLLGDLACVILVDS